MLMKAYESQCITAEIRKKHRDGRVGRCLNCLSRLGPCFDRSTSCPREKKRKFEHLDVGARRISRHAINRVGWRGDRPGALFGGRHVMSSAMQTEVR